jgi:hypothetical protein
MKKFCHVKTNVIRELYILRYCMMSSGGSLPVLPRNVLPLSSGLFNGSFVDYFELSGGICHELITTVFLSFLFLFVCIILSKYLLRVHERTISRLSIKPELLIV